MRYINYEFNKRKTKETSMYWWLIGLYFWFYVSPAMGMMFFTIAIIESM